MGVSAAQGSAGLKPGVCTSTTRPSNPFEGQMIYETDTDSTLIWTGSYWQSTAPRENLIINGAMQITQRSAVGTAVTPVTTGYHTADRFRAEISSLGTFSQTTIADAPAGSGFTNSVKLDCTTADASPAAGDYFIFEHKIEGQNLQAVRKGTASAQKLTLSFWVKSFQTGTFIAELQAGSRSCSKAYTISVSNTWEYKTILFPADTTTVIANDNTEGLAVNWWLGAGTTYTSGTLQTTWAASVAANRAVGVTNLASAATGEWFMTGASLTIGDADVPFQFKSFGEYLTDCQRYYHQMMNTDGNMQRMVVTTLYTYWTQNFWFPVEMRAAPTITTFNGVGSGLVAGYYDPDGGGVASTTTSRSDRRGFAFQVPTTRNGEFFYKASADL